MASVQWGEHIKTTPIKEQHDRVKKALDLEQSVGPNSNFFTALPSYVILGKLLYISEPRFSHLIRVSICICFLLLLQQIITILVA